MKLDSFRDLSLLILGSAGFSLAFHPIAINKACSRPTSLFAVNNNVVLRPSSPDEDVFDNLKIGSCKVHRYRKENDPDSETEYVMWYHGRSVQQDSDKSLPPLSTGRIGRATSKNGLSWKKDTVGSASEDMKGVAIGLNEESWWGFDTAHAGLGSVLLPMSTPAVMTEGGVYLMYYMGGTFEETPIGDYVDKEMPADAMIKGMKMKIGVCVSQDGQTWGRVEGDDPSGACLSPYDASDPNMKQLAQLRDDTGIPVKLEEELYVGWPEVVPIIDEEDSENSGFLMYYSTMTKADKVKAIGHAISKDGFRWEPRGICFRPSPGTMDGAGVARCTVVRNAVFDDESSTWNDARGYTMLYEGVSEDDGKHRIMKAESVDGKTWVKLGVVFDVGEDGAWDSAGVGSPNILRMDDGSQRMYYTGQGSDGSTAIGVAKLAMDSSDGWVREQASILFADS
mmetsp:Transcript_8982/g.25801  ORF Transcript_8982/g.25801 Transcript_8982/m.25801 type:complete len:452 (+) Transcript_8982:109-1464(+)